MSTSQPASGKTCPSSVCQEGAQVLGVMTGEGRLAYLNPAPVADAEFAARELARGHPERRFRFAGRCAEGGCPQWTGTGCAIADLAADAAGSAASGSRVVDLGLPGLAAPQQPVTLPRCAIRRSCRWYAQRGPAACAACPLIVADMGGTATYRSEHPARAAS